MKMPMPRRQLLKALGLGALAGLVPRGWSVRADGGAAPARVVFFIQPHGHVPHAWNMALPAASDDGVATRSLLGIPRDEFSAVLQPLYAFRDRLLVVEGLAHTSVLSDLAAVRSNGGDDNNHALAVAGLLTLTRALQRPNVPCTGGSRSIDQELARRTSAQGRFGSRVYGADYVPNATVAPFSFLAAGQPTPVVADPKAAFDDLLGFVKPRAHAAPNTREERLSSLRSSVLDSAAEEFEALAPRLQPAERRTLEAHRDLVRELELSLGSQQPAECTLAFDARGDAVSPFMRLIRMALACDLTRVVTYVAPVPECPEFGYPADAGVHSTYAHGSVEGNTSCGQAYSLEAERAMTDLGVWYGRHFAELLAELDAVAEGDGTLLDHTTVVWLTELGTPTHQHHDAFTLLAGGTHGFFEMGRYVRFARTLQNPLADAPRIGPAHSRLLISLMQAMGQSDDAFGMTTAMSASGATLDLQGALSALHKRA